MAVKILYDIESDSQGTLTASTEDPNFPLSNLRLQSLAKKFSFTGNTSETLSINFEAGVSIEGIGLQTNLTDSGVITINIYPEDVIDGGTNATLPSDIIDGGTNATVPTDIIDGNPSEIETINLTGADANKHGVIFAQFSQAYDGYSLEITFSDSGNSDNIKIGRFALGPVLTLPDIRSKPKIAHNNTSKSLTSRSGQVYGTKGYQFLSVDTSFPDLTEADKDNLYDLFDEVGLYKAYFIDLFCNDIEKPMYVVNGFKSAKYTYQDFDGYTVGLKIREAF